MGNLRCVSIRSIGSPVWLDIGELGCQLQPFADVVAEDIVMYAKVEKGGKQSLTICVVFP